MAAQGEGRGGGGDGPKQGNLTSATLLIHTHDGQDSSDLTELSETLNETQQKALLGSLRNAPTGTLSGQ